MECIVCKRNQGDFVFKSVEVRSIVTPGKSGFLRKDRQPAQRSQKLGEIIEFGVCNECIERKYHDIMYPWKDFINTCKVAIILLIFALVILFNYGGKDTVYTIGGIVLLVLALYRFLKYFLFAKRRRDEYKKFSKNNRRFVVAWECVSQAAPKRDGVESIYFIPMTSATENMKREDFIKYYGLTQDNAEKFYKMIHGKGKASKKDEPLISDEGDIDDREPNTDLSEAELKD